jgi:hypothetical protein
MGCVGGGSSTVALGSAGAMLGKVGVTVGATVDPPSAEGRAGCSDEVDGGLAGLLPNGAAEVDNLMVGVAVAGADVFSGMVGAGPAVGGPDLLSGMVGAGADGRDAPPTAGAVATIGGRIGAAMGNVAEGLAG